MTEGDNRNVMSAQLAAEALGCRRVVAKVNDPLRAEAYADLGLATICRTDLMLDAVLGLRRPAATRVPAACTRRPATTIRRQPTTAPMPGPASNGATAASARAPVRPWSDAHDRDGRPDRVRAGRRRRQGRLLPVARSSSRPATRSSSSRRIRARAEQIADEIGSIVIAHDGCEGKYLGEAGANRADIVAAVTGDDEDNLVICQMAKHHFDVPRTIARVNNPKNEALFKHLGVDEIISPTRMVLGSIEQDIPVHELLHLGTLGELRPRDHRGAPPRRLAGHRPGAERPGHPRGLLAVRGRPRRPGDAAPAGHDPRRGRQGHRDRPGRVRGGPPRPAHRRRGGRCRAEVAAGTS